MADSHFFAVSGPFTLDELAETAQAGLADDADRTKRIVDIAPLNSA